MDDYTDNTNANTTVTEPKINEQGNIPEPGRFTLSSSAFGDEQNIPVRFCNVGIEGGENYSIPYSWSNEPKNTKSYFLVIIDTHPVAENFIHWATKDIPSEIHGISENASQKNMPGGIELTNSYGMKGYGGPQPPPGTGRHAYEAYIFALSTENIEISNAPSWAEIQTKVQPYVITSAKYVGFFGR